MLPSYLLGRSLSPSSHRLCSVRGLGLISRLRNGGSALNVASSAASSSCLLINQPQCRGYWYLPTSWTELKYRMQRIREKRKIKVKIFQKDAAERWSQAVQRYQSRRQRLSSRRKRIQKKFKDQRESMMDKMWRGKRISVSLPEYSEEHWFDPSTGRPLTSRDPTGRFVNPWLAQSTDGVQSLSNILQWRWERTLRYWRELTGRGGFLSLLPPPKTNPIREMTLNIEPMTAIRNYVQHPPDRIPKASDIGPNTIQLTWMGHATSLLQQDDMNILLDPMFSVRASPFRDVVGIARSVPPSHTAVDLPAVIDLCLISHDHYDHLDKQSCIDLRDRVQKWIVPLGLAEWLHDKCEIPLDRVTELEWWESVHLHKKKQQTMGKQENIVSWEERQRHKPHAVSNTTMARSSLHPAILQPPPKGSVWITCLPAQHWSSRTFFDRNYRLWSSLAIVGEAGTVFYAGDTALPPNFPLFEQIRDYLGSPIDLSLLPIGAYEPDYYMLDAHMDPFQAVEVHERLRSRRSIGVHWGTFCLSEEPLHEPPMLLREAVKRSGEDLNFETIKIGASMKVATRQGVNASDDSDDDDGFLSDEDDHDE